MLGNDLPVPDRSPCTDHCGGRQGLASHLLASAGGLLTPHTPQGASALVGARAARQKGRIAALGSKPTWF
jgi:hypothetical protein